MQQQYSASERFNQERAASNMGVAGQFVRVVRQILKAGAGGPNWLAMQDYFEKRAHEGRAVAFAKAAVASDGTDAWASPDGQALSHAYLTEYASGNLIDAVKRYALPLPDTRLPVWYATGAIANEVNEGKAKPLSRFTLTLAAEQRAKIAAAIVVTDEVAMSDSLDAANLVERLLRDAVIKESNERFLARLPTQAIAGGADAVTSLKLGLAAVDASSGYVVAATPAATRELALASDGRMHANGGEFVPGVLVVPALEGASGGHSLTVIPASQYALRDYGLEFRSAGHASVQMDDAPTNSASAAVTATTEVSLWQNNAKGLLVERHFALHAPASAPAIEVSTGA